MPMLTTFRIRCPCGPSRCVPHALSEVAHPVEHGVHLGHDVLAIHDDLRPSRGTQRHVQDGTLSETLILSP